MKAISLKELLEAGCHFGHQTTRWNPQMKPYIHSARDRIHIFDLVKTKAGLEQAREVIKTAVVAGGQLLLVGTKRQAQSLIKEAALKVGMPYVTERWVGGLLTNWSEVKKRVDRLKELRADREAGKFKQNTKKENLLVDREINRLQRIFGGVEKLAGVPAVIFVVDAHKDQGALREAKRRGVVTVAVVDTNADPALVDQVIPANDDAVKSIELIMAAITEAVEEGLQARSRQQVKTDRPRPRKKKVLETLAAEEPEVEIAD